MDLQVKAKHHGITEYIVPLNNREAVYELKATLRLRGASVHETMGPHWKNIYWINNRPHVTK